ncbi:indole-3-glycerol-phosphate synthase [Candidatus Gottesmanbacteria bacterium]|nr:indole-3-glycerol-phosphate synthase [Candidatus Gottesmanbacteria bacterium]MBI5452617.1 indole-3-glycerol-phosphate synthase [Candidatus Gottesmanbacteria bacterium]
MKITLDEIITNKLQEIAEKKKVRGFLNAIKTPKAGNIAIIAEIKLTTPSAGKLGDVIDIEKKVKSYEKGLADAISVVVDKKYFGGDLEFIRRVKSIVSLPVLTKDFIIDPYQIYEMKAYGADAILLIAKILNKKKLKQYVELCFEVGLEPIVEIQNRKELNDAIATNTRIIAVNARDLNTFEVDMDKACGLLKFIPQYYLTLGFSGVSSRCDVEKYIASGAKGILVGTSLMKAKNIEEFIKELKSL